MLPCEGSKDAEQLCQCKCNMCLEEFQHAPMLLRCGLASVSEANASRISAFARVEMLVQRALQATKQRY
jgi:hypothetical protein